jgi:hypothetical protein
MCYFVDTFWNKSIKTIYSTSLVPICKKGKVNDHENGRDMSC